MRRLVRQFLANPKRFFFLFWILSAPALLVLGASPALSQPYSFETATLGTTGVTTGGLLIGGDGEMQLVGAKFEILHPTKITHMGGHVAGNQVTPSDIFVAVVPLDGVTDLPASTTLADALFVASFNAPYPSDEVTLTANFTLSPGRYGIVFGSELFGSTGEGTMPCNDSDVGSPEYFFTNYTNPTFVDGSFDNCRFFIRGQIMPSKHALVLLDRTGSMITTRPASGNSRCKDALDLAKLDVQSFFNSYPESTGASLAVWTFSGSAPTDLTGGFVGLAAASAALSSLQPEGCSGATPLADALCDAGDALVQEFPNALPAQRILAVSSDGGENNSTGACSGFWSTTPAPYDPGSWQYNVKDRLVAQMIVESRFWGAVNRKPGVDVETGNLLQMGVSDTAFFEDLSQSTGGTYTFVGDGDPLPPPFFLRPLVEVPTLSFIGMLAMVILLTTIAMRLLRKNG